MSRRPLRDRLRAAADRARREVSVYRRVAADERTGWLPRALLVAALAYAVSPVDLIPDVIPVLGQLDDLLVVPGLVWLALRFIPAAVVADARAARPAPDAP